MELSRQEVPLYGQVEICVLLKVSLSDQEKAEYYVLLEGSSLHHVTRAQKKEEGNLLSFTVPGHNVPEKVLLRIYCWEQGNTCGQITPLPGSEELLLEYKRDDIQEVADLLLSTPDLLTSSKYQDIQKKYCLTGSFQCGEASSNVELEPSGLGEPEEMSGFDQRLHESKEQTHGRENDHNPTGSSEQLPSAVEVKITQALANTQSLLQWNSPNSQESQDVHCKDTSLHTTVNLGLGHLTLFYLQQSAEQKTATLSNGEGHAPVQLSQNRGDAQIISALNNPLVFKEWKSLWMSEVWDDGYHLLRFCPATNSLILTVKHSTHTDAQNNIQLYREKTRDSGMQMLVSDLSGIVEKSRSRQLDDTSDGDVLLADLSSQSILEDCALVDQVFEDQLISLDEGEESPPKFSSEKSGSSPGSYAALQPHATLTAAGRLATMFSRTRKDEDLHRKTHTAGGTVHSSGLDTRDWPALGTPIVSSGVTDAPPSIREEDELREKQPWSRPFSPTFSQFSPTSPAGLVLDRFLQGARPAEQTYHRSGSPPDSYDLSPSLVALEMNSEEVDDVLMKKPLPQISPDPKSNKKEQDSVKPTSDLSCIHSHSTSSAYNHTSSKDSGDQGVRRRSYSYSSPRISLLPPCFSRDVHPPPTDPSSDGALSSSSCSSRSLLQALSLSKSLSLLNPVKQRTFSLTEQLQEKREVSFHRRSQSADDEASVELGDSLQYLTLSEFLKEIQEEEWDRYIIPSKMESEKHKVSRTFSFIKSCMYSTRNKSKGKWKEREAKEKQANSHQLAVGSTPGPAVCDVCNKLTAGKETLHCTNCTVTIHKGCKDSAVQCLKKVQEKYAVSMVKARAATLPQNFMVRGSTSSSAMLTSASLPVMSPWDRNDSTPILCPLSKSVPLVPERLAERPEGDSDCSAWRTNVQSEEIFQSMESFTFTDSSLMEDTVDAALPSALGADMLGLEVDSWSLAVEPSFCQRQEKRTIKRQDVIYELMQTELHHLQTLTIMAEVFRRGMRDEVGLDADTIGRIFPCLDELLFLHKDFLSALRDRQHSSTQPDSDRNYLIHRVGDILLHQFTQENAKNMKQVYGEFCSHHSESVSFFKELQQQNKKFQLFIKQQSSNSLVKRREIPECILLVTQRITKYPVLLERILQYTEDGTTEHRELSSALTGVRELISAVDMRVSEREQSQWLGDVLARMEGKSAARLKSGLAFRKQDLASGHTLLYHGPLLWKSATGRLKDVLALLLSDLLVFLQEKDQKFIFAAVDQKPPVISLQKLIVREVANEERGMFLISTSSAGPEMYEVHATSKEERNTWMRLIREAVVICHEKEDDAANESEEERRAAEAKVQKIHKLQETLCGQDQLICSSLEEKLQIYAELSALAGGMGPEPHLLVRPGTLEPPHATALLNAALREAETLRAALLPRCASPSRASPLAALKEPSAPDTSTPTETLPPAPSPPPLAPEGESPLLNIPRGEQEELGREENPELQAENHIITPEDHNMHLKVCQSVQSLTQLLYSLQAAVTIQDSCYEVQRLLHLLLSSPAQPCPVGGGSPGSLALQERQREEELRLWRRNEELQGASLERQRQLNKREWQARRTQQCTREDVLHQREQRCHLEARRLQRERDELHEQLRDYQQSLERLHEGQRSVESQRQLLEAQRRLLQGCPPTTLIPLDGQQCLNLNHGHFGGREVPGSNFVNEAAVVTVAMNNRHLHHHQSQPSSHQGYSDSPSAQNSLNSLLAWSNNRQASSGMAQPPLASEGIAGGQEVAPPINAREAWPPGIRGVGFYQDDALSVPTSLVSMETESQDAAGEENIVYL